MGNAVRGNGIEYDMNGQTHRFFSVCVQMAEVRASGWCLFTLGLPIDIKPWTIDIFNMVGMWEGING